MRTPVACVCLLIIASFAASARDLADYDKLGPLEQGLVEPQSKLSRTRDFVWQHWTKHRRGYAIITRYSKEGEASVFHFYVEPDADGAWQVVIDGEHERIGRPGGTDSGKRWHHRSHHVAYRVKRVQNYEGGYHFEFANAGGKIVSIW